MRGEAYRTADRLRRRIESIRGLDYKLSPPLNLAAAPVEAEPPARADWRLWILGGAGGLILLFLIYFFSLSYRVSDLQETVGSIR